MKTCTKCHRTKPLDAFWIDKRRGRCARCIECRTADNAAYRAKRDPAAAKTAEHRRYWSNVAGERERHLVRKYGVTQARYEQMLAEQGGACAVCDKRQERALDVDHDHRTGRVRGLLCTSCNRMIGHAGDNAETLRTAAAYLERIVPQVAEAFIRSSMSA